MSIPANIVEDRGQKSDRQFARFLGYAINSSSELEYHLIVARDAKLISLADSRSLVDQTIEVRKMLRGLLKTVDASALVPSSAE
jgi:four helix bundle protein